MATAIIQTRAFVKRLTALLRTDLVVIERRLEDQNTIRLTGMLAAALAIIATLVKLV
jgi:hypothetical protein